MGSIAGRCATVYQPKRRVQWLWKPFIHRHVVNLLTGGPGTGKSTIACDIAAALSTARPLPGEADETSKERGVLRTWLLNAEDDPQDTILWRLENQGANLEHIYITPQGQPIGAETAQEMIQFIKANDIALTVVDPVQAWIGAETDMYRPNHMRAWGNLFRDICEQTGTTVLWVRHRRKGDADDHNTINSGLGSIDLSGIVRSEIGAIVTKRGSKITRIKGSVGRTNDTLYYQIRDTGDPENDHGQLFWTGEVEQEAPKGGAKHNAVIEWLITHLINGPKSKSELTIAASRLYGCSNETVRKAAAEIAVEEKANGKKLWRLRTPKDVDERHSDTETEASEPS